MTTKPTPPAKAAFFTDIKQQAADKNLLRSFGRTSWKLSANQKGKLEEKLASYSLANKPLPQDKPLEVEIGMGNGLSLFERAQARPDWHFVGNEVYLNGLRSLLHAIGQRPEGDLPNLNIHADDGRALMANETLLPNACAKRVCVLHPDPWPKTKHHKRRIIQQDFLKQCARVLDEGGELVLVTDIPCYAQWMIAEVYKSGLFETTAVSAQDWATPPAWWIETKYQAKAERERRGQFFLVYRKK